MSEYKNMPELHFHPKSQFDSSQDVGEVIARLKELGTPGVALTDHGVMTAIPTWRKSLEAEGLKCIPGCELYVDKKLGELTVITDIEHRTMYDILQGRNQRSLTEYFMNLPDREKVQWVCSDMYRPFEKSIATAMPNARWAIDHFHVVMKANEAVDYVRRELQKVMTNKDRIKTKRGNMRQVIKSFYSVFDQSVNIEIPDRYDEDDKNVLNRYIYENESIYDKDKIYLCGIRKAHGVKSALNEDKAAVRYPEIYSYFAKDSTVEYVFSEDKRQESFYNPDVMHDLWRNFHE